MMRRTGAKRASRNGAGSTRMRFLVILGALSHTIPGNPGVRERRKRHGPRTRKGGPTDRPQQGERCKPLRCLFLTRT